MRVSTFVRSLFVLTLALFLADGPVFAKTGEEAARRLLEKVSSRKGAAGFSARFSQESPLKAIGVVEKASGRVWFKKPGRVRWEYELPEPMVYVSDGTLLWVYSPEGNQVWMGAADAFFGESGGARILSDLTQVSRRFSLFLEGRERGFLKVLLTPKSDGDAVSRVDLLVDPESYDIVESRSVRRVGDETTLRFSAITPEVLPDEHFEFTPPEGAVVTPLQ